MPDGNADFLRLRFKDGASYTLKAGVVEIIDQSGYREAAPRPEDHGLALLTRADRVGAVEVVDPARQTEKEGLTPAEFQAQVNRRIQGAALPAKFLVFLAAVGMALPPVVPQITPAMLKQSLAHLVQKMYTKALNYRDQQTFNKVIQSLDHYFECVDGEMAAKLNDQIHLALKADTPLDSRRFVSLDNGVTPYSRLDAIFPQLAIGFDLSAIKPAEGITRTTFNSAIKHIYDKIKGIKSNPVDRVTMGIGNVMTTQFIQFIDATIEYPSLSQFETQLSKRYYDDSSISHAININQIQADIWSLILNHEHSQDIPITIILRFHHFGDLKVFLFTYNPTNEETPLLAEELN